MQTGHFSSAEHKRHIFVPFRRKNKHSFSIKAPSPSKCGIFSLIFFLPPFRHLHFVKDFNNIVMLIFFRYFFSFKQNKRGKMLCKQSRLCISDYRFFYFIFFLFSCSKVARLAEKIKAVENFLAFIRPYFLNGGVLKLNWNFLKYERDIFRKCKKKCKIKFNFNFNINFENLLNLKFSFT